MRVLSVTRKTASVAAAVWFVTAVSATAGPPTPYHSAGADTAGLVWMAADGDDRASGARASEPVAGGERASALATAGGRIWLRPGSYGPLRFVGLRGTPGRPIVIEPAPGDPTPGDSTPGDRDPDAEPQAGKPGGPVVVSTGHLNRGLALTLERCEHVVVRGLEVTLSQRGVGLHSCGHCVVESCRVHNLGQEGIHVGRGPSNDRDNPFIGPASHDIIVRGNHVEGTGRATAIYGEGIYIGTGAVAGDDTHDVLIEGNVLRDISAEAVELKPGTYNLTVRGNDISNTHHEYNAAITACVEGTTGRGGNYRIENNRIQGVRKVRYSVAGIAIGHGDAVIRGNVIRDVDGGVGVWVVRRFQNPDARRITIAENVLPAGGPDGGVVLHRGDAGRGEVEMKAVVELRGNVETNEPAAARPPGPVDGR